jgi:hypothetical protein
LEYTRENDPRINPEKWPDTPARFVVHRGVTLDSRYRHRDEFGVMAAIVDYVDDSFNCTASLLIEKIFCDSKATNCYTVTLSHDGATVRDEVAQLCQEAVIAVRGGHNGIWIETAFDVDFLVVLDPWWDEPDLDAPDGGHPEVA